MDIAVKEERPKILVSKTAKVETGCGTMYVTVSFFNDPTFGLRPFEVFGTLGKPRGCARAQSEALTRCITTGLRHGVPIQSYKPHLTGIACPAPTPTVSSCPDAIQKGIEIIMEEVYGPEFNTGTAHSKDPIGHTGEGGAIPPAEAPSL